MASRGQMLLSRGQRRCGDGGFAARGSREGKVYQRIVRRAGCVNRKFNVEGSAPLAHTSHKQFFAVRQVIIKMARTPGVVEKAQRRSREDSIPARTWIHCLPGQGYLGHDFLPGAFHSRSKDKCPIAWLSEGHPCRRKKVPQPNQNPMISFKLSRTVILIKHSDTISIISIHA